VTESLNLTTKHYSAYKIKYYSYVKSDSSSYMQELTRVILTAVKLCKMAVSSCCENQESIIHRNSVTSQETSPQQHSCEDLKF